MKSRYRLIQFVPDHFNGNRYSVGAVVDDGDGVRVVIAEHIPGAECLGSDTSFMLLRHNLDDLRGLRSFERLPMSIGPHFELTDPKQIDVADVDPVEWLRADILPRPLEKKSKARKRGPNRSTIGKEYLGQFGVGDYIESFDPRRDLPMLNGTTDVFPSISQSVSGQVELVLMEPIAPKLKSVTRHVKSVTINFSASRQFLKDVKTPVEMYAYIMPGGQRSEREEIRAHLEQGAHRVFDMVSMSQREELVGRIDEVGASGDVQHRLS